MRAAQVLRISIASNQPPQVGKMVRRFTHISAPEKKRYTEIKISISPCAEPRSIKTIDWVLAPQKHPACLGCALVSHGGRHFRTAQHHTANGEPPDEPKNPPTTAIGIDDET